ncbi:Cytosolic non-specific dipeptidase [Chionoecetes opilio]|uniref:Cytosolic non-specific dipeptidase n=1 Tax=Chionoecetes opilio TaxID=41210 RepID=A0A8J4XVS0_CHIOP|nr:Cytosolic non-specific dipeptidase [Chionoecetes opilio]
MAPPESLAKIFKYVDDNKTRYIDVLRESVAIKSVSAWPASRGEIVRQMEWAKAKLEALGATCALHDIGMQTLPDGKEIPLPPVLMGQLGSDPKKKTLCVYGHLDVQPALKEDGWDTEPFVLIEKDGKLYGRGSTDDKGPVIGWIHAIEAYQKNGLDVPVNVKFVFEGMEESGSEGLEELLKAQKDKFLAGTDFVCISDNYWLGKNKPCITYGLRGICYFCIEVQCCEKDLHSGVFGGTVHEGMADLVYLMNTLLDGKGNILIPGLMDEVAPLTSEEQKLYADIDFDVEDYRKDLGHKRLIHHQDKPINSYKNPACATTGGQEKKEQEEQGKDEQEGDEQGKEEEEQGKDEQEGDEQGKEEEEQGKDEQEGDEQGKEEEEQGKDEQEGDEKGKEEQGKEEQGKEEQEKFEQGKEEQEKEEQEGDEQGKEELEKEEQEKDEQGRRSRRGTSSRRRSWGRRSWRRRSRRRTSRGRTSRRGRSWGRTSRRGTSRRRRAGEGRAGEGAAGGGRAGGAGAGGRREEEEEEGGGGGGGAGKMERKR